MYYLGESVAIDYRKSAEHYRTAALQGNANAMNNLACLYQEGKGVPKDDKEAVRWFEKAAELGDPEALTTLGYITIHGFGVPKDQPKGYHMIKEAAEDGYAPAQRKLGLYYMDGHGMLKNLGEAEKWLTLAAVQGDLEALSTIVDLMLADKIKKLTRDEVMEWLYEEGLDHISENDKETALQCLSALKRLDSTHFLVKRLEREIEKA
jgi:TPR repeat protein